jgi:hypothetical protein
MWIRPGGSHCSEKAPQGGPCIDHVFHLQISISPSVLQAYTKVQIPRLSSICSLRNFELRQDRTWSARPSRGIWLPWPAHLHQPSPTRDQLRPLFHAKFALKSFYTPFNAKDGKVNPIQCAYTGLPHAPGLTNPSRLSTAPPK